MLRTKLRMDTWPYDDDFSYEVNCAKASGPREWQGGETKDGMVFCRVGDFPSFRL